MTVLCMDELTDADLRILAVPEAPAESAPAVMACVHAAAGDAASSLQMEPGPATAPLRPPPPP